MPLVCRLETSSTIPIEAESIRPDLLRGQTADQIAKAFVQHGNGTVLLGELFNVSGSLSDDDTIEWQGNCSQVRGIGQGLTSGTIRVRGNAGMHLGAEMRGGKIFCEGSAGDWLGCEMRGGSIDVQENAGSSVGGTYVGGQKGMTGGEIIVRGNVGHEVGRCMRRGLIAIGGSCGIGTAFGMIAGTILINGVVGGRLGAGMKRGTLICLNQQARCGVLPTFRPSGHISPQFFRVLWNRLKPYRCFITEIDPSAEFDRCIGDCTEDGKGEILIIRN